jgi:hypothetical protein
MSTTDPVFFYSLVNDTCNYDNEQFVANNNTANGDLCAYIPNTSPPLYVPFMIANYLLRIRLMVIEYSPAPRPTLYAGAGRGRVRVATPLLLAQIRSPARMTPLIRGVATRLMKNARNPLAK